MAIKAMQRIRQQIPSAILVIAGQPTDIDGEKYLKELHGICDKLDLTDAVRFDTRFIPNNMIHYYIGASSIILIPYTESVGAIAPTTLTPGLSPSGRESIYCRSV